MLSHVLLGAGVWERLEQGGSGQIDAGLEQMPGEGVVFGRRCSKPDSGAAMPPPGGPRAPTMACGLCSHALYKRK